MKCVHFIPNIHVMCSIIISYIQLWITTRLGLLCQTRAKIKPSFIFGQKIYLSEKILVVKKLQVQKIFWWKNFWVPNFCAKKLLGQKKLWPQNFFECKKILCEKILGLKNFWVPKKFCVWKQFWYAPLL